MPLAKMWANFLKALNPKLATTGHVGNNLFNSLAYSAALYIIFGTFWVKEFIIDVVLMIGPISISSNPRWPLIFSS